MATAFARMAKIGPELAGLAALALVALLQFFVLDTRVHYK